MATTFEPTDAHPLQQDAPAQPSSAAAPSGTLGRWWATLRELTRSVWRRRPGWMSSMEEARKFVLNAIVVGGVAIAVVLAIKAGLSGATIIIDPISMPKELAERGYTGEVIAHRIHDHISEIYRVGRVPLLRGHDAEHADFTTIPPERSVPTIEFPGSGLSLAAVASAIRGLIRGADTKIAGEITREDPPAGGAEGAPNKQQRYLLLLRITDHGALSSLTTPTDDLDDLVHSAALQVVERFDPISAARYYHLKHDLPRALKLANAALKGDRRSDDLEALGMRGLIAWAHEDYEEALDEFGHTLELFPKDAASHRRKASVLLRQEHYKEALEAARESIRHDPTYAPAYNTAAVALIYMHQYDEAMSLLHRTIENAPRYAVAYYNQGIIFRNRKPQDAEKAIAMFRKAIDINPDYALAYATWGSLAKDLGRREKAKRLYERAIEADSKSWSYNNLLGVLHLEDLEWEKAAESFRTARRLDPRRLEPHFNLGRAKRGAGKLEEAIAIFEEVVAGHPRHAWSYSQWGLTLAQIAQQKLDESKALSNLAEEKLKMAIDLAPDDEHVLQDVREARAILDSRERIAEPG